jgi:hypothetical protein
MISSLRDMMIAPCAMTGDTVRQVFFNATPFIMAHSAVIKLRSNKIISSSGRHANPGESNK